MMELLRNCLIYKGQDEGNKKRLPLLALRHRPYLLHHLPERYPETLLCLLKDKNLGLLDSACHE